jgi:cell division protein FtsB
MLEFYQQKSLRTYLRTPLALIILAIVCLFLARIVYERYTISREMAARTVTEQVELEALLERKAQLEEKVEYLSNERGIEAEMRRNFDVARAGEQVVIILDKEADESTIEPMAAMPEPEPAWYQFWR